MHGCSVSIRICVERPYRYANAARFIKHVDKEEQANLVAINVMIDDDWPSLAFFASRRIEACEELTHKWPTIDTD